MTEGFVLAHRVEGPTEAPALVLLGSLGSNLAMWDPQVDGLGEELRMVRLDHRGHGGSPVPAGPYSVAGLGADVLATLDQLGIARASFCGISLGGSVAMWVARNAPGRVARLIVAFSSACYGGRDAWLERAALVRAEGTTAVADAVVARWFTPALGNRDPEAVARMREMIAATPAEGYAGCCEALAEFDIREELAKIGAPTLVLSGGGDPATPAEHGELIASGIPNARFVLVPSVAHLGSFENPDLFNSLVGAHMRQKESSS